MLAELLPYYQRELFYLRQLGKEFAAKHKDIAARLQIEGDRCEDPHVERLIEAFAFLTARVHKKLDDEFPLITDAFLGVLYPHLLRPIPSMSIAQFQLDPANPQLTERYAVPRHTQLYTRDTAGVHGMPCTFRTCYPVDVWPVHVTEAHAEPIERSPFAQEAGATGVVRIKLATIGELSFSELGLDKLRFFIDGDPTYVHALHELILNSGEHVVLSAGKGARQAKVRLERNSLKPVGFELDDGVLAYDSRSFLGYRLLQEYFTCPDKFFFFDLVNLEPLKHAEFGRELDIVIFLGKFERAERLQSLAQVVNRETFKLACTPVINLFKQYADPIRITNEKYEYAVIPDARRLRGLEVYSIEKVEKTIKADGHDHVVEFQPFFSHKHSGQANSPNTFWISRRSPSPLKDDKGTNVDISLVDLKFSDAVSEAETLSLTLMCTNRDLPAQLPFGGDHGYLDMEGASGVSRIRLLRKPSASIRMDLKKGGIWRLISHLSLNHLSLVSEGREALQEILNLYNFSNSPTVTAQIAGITGLASAPSISRIGTPQASSFVRGTNVTLEFDENAYSGGGVYLFSMVLERFLGLYCTLNSYVQLTVRTRQREQELAKWPPRTGEAVLL